MKKTVFASFIVVTFIIYSFVQRQPATTPVALVSPVVSTPAPTPADTPQELMATAKPTAIPTVVPTPQGKFKDGTYTGAVADAYYGNVQVQAVVQSGKLTDVTFLQYPNDRRHSLETSQYAMPQLKQEAIAAQDSQVDSISGASDTSAAFIQSLADALQQAK